jgi:hypothetical protein
MPRQRIEAFAAAIWACVRRLIWLAMTYPLAGRKRAMRRQVRRFEYLVECMLVLRAALLVRAPPQRRRHRYTPTGFRRTHTNPRRFMRLARIRLRGGSLLARLHRLIVVLRAPQAYIARLAQRLRRGVCWTHLVAAAPPARTFITRAAPILPALADSS